MAGNDLGTKHLLQQFGDDDESKQKREEHFKKVQALKNEEKAYDQRMARYLQYLRDLRELRRFRSSSRPSTGTQATRWTAAAPWPATWTTIHSARRSGSSRPAKLAARSGSGLFRDVDDNGVMEFAGRRRLRRR